MNSGFEQYVTLETAYRWLNCEFFEGKLPGAILTLNRHSSAYGYFVPDRFTGRQEAGKSGQADEIALNPDCFEREDIDIFATLLHELCHQWQTCFGTPSRSGYHNAEWTAKMIEVGLCPSDTGRIGGKQTGQHMTQWIIPDGPFAKRFAEKQFRVEWRSTEIPSVMGPTLPGKGPEGKKTGKRHPVSKQKYSCPSCGLNAWAKPGASLMCGDCQKPMSEQS